MRSTSLAFFCLLAMGSRSVAADEHHYALIVGYNGHTEMPGPEKVPVLKFADDDALAYYRFSQELGDDAILLTVLDSETRHRFPEHHDPDGPPTLAALDEAVTKLASSMDADKRTGRTPVFTFYFSGHGVLDKDSSASLVLWDGVLSRVQLYERVLDRLPAKIVHLIVDACHAEAVLRPRDATAATKALTTEDIAAVVGQSTLARYPQAGLAIASSSEANAHEWDEFQSGVFTHELLSGLRGAADVNGDGRVEYSELAAFLSAVNYGIQDPRARLRAIVKPPVRSVHAALSDLSRARSAGRLVGIPSPVGRFSVDDSRGTRLVDGKAETGFAMSILLPADQPLFVTVDTREADLLLKPASERSYDSLTFRNRTSRTRGALETSLRKGVFATPYGPAYYRGYVGQSDAVVPVAFPDLTVRLADTRLAIPAPETPHAKRKYLRWSLAAASGALLVSSVVFAGLAWDAQRDFDRSPYPAQASAPADRYHRDTIVAATLLVSGLVSAGATYLFAGDR